MKFDSRDLTSTALFAALYVVINVVQSVTVGNPTIYGPIQLRVADFMIALAVLFGWPLIGGVTLGCFLTNAYYFLGAPDVVLGPVANLIAAYLGYVLEKTPFVSLCSRSFAHRTYCRRRTLVLLLLRSSIRFLWSSSSMGSHDRQHYYKQFNRNSRPRVQCAFDTEPTKNYRAFEVSWIESRFPKVAMLRTFQASLIR